MMRGRRALACAVPATAILLAPGRALATVVATDVSIDEFATLSGVLAPIVGIAPTILRFAAAAAVVAIIAAIARAMVLPSDSASAAAAARVVRVLAFCALLASMAALFTGFYELTGGSAGAAGIGLVN